MIGMDFIGFLILLVISVVVSAILQYGLKYYVTPGFWSFCFKVVLGYVGAWLGSPVLGYWPMRSRFSTTRTFGSSRRSSGRWRCWRWP